MREIISCRMSDRVLLCIGSFQLNFLAKKALGGRSLDMIMDSGSFGVVRDE